MTRFGLACRSGFVALTLLAPLIGLRVSDGILIPRPLETLAVVLPVALVAALRPRRRETVAAPSGQPSRPFVTALAVAAFALPLLGSRRLTDVATQVVTYVMLGWGLNIVVGLAGLLDLGYVAFYAVGAYAYAILATAHGLGFWTCLPICGALSAIAGIVFGFPVLRLRGDYLAIVTLAFGEIIRTVLNNWVTLTNGPRGILDVPRPTLLGWTPHAAARAVMLYYLVLTLALLTNALVLRLRDSSIGRSWEAVREDELAARAMGVDVTVAKLTAFATGAAVAGVAGAFFAAKQAFVSPESFTFVESATVLAIVVLGGMGSQVGTALAALVMVGGLEGLRDVLSAAPGLLVPVAELLGDPGRYRMLLFGITLVGAIVLFPRGLVAGRISMRAPRH